MGRARAFAAIAAVGCVSALFVEACVGGDDNAGPPPGGGIDASFPDTNIPLADTGPGGDTAPPTDSGATKGTIVEDFLDPSTLDPDATSAIVDPLDGGALLAPVVFPFDDGCDAGAVVIPGDAGAYAMAPGTLRADSFTIAAGTNVIVDGGDLDLHVCHDVTMNGALAVSGVVRANVGGNVVIGASSNGIASQAGVHLALPTPGATLTIVGGDIYSQTSPGNDGVVEVRVNGDATMTGGGIWSNGAIDHAPAGVHIAVAGNFDQHEILYTEAYLPIVDGGDPYAAPPLDVRVKGNMVGGEMYVDWDPKSTGAIGTTLDVNVGGSFTSTSGGNPCTWGEGQGTKIRMHARGDFLAPETCVFADVGNTDMLIELESLGKFTCNGQIFGSGGPITIRANAVELAAQCDLFMENVKAPNLAPRDVTITSATDIHAVGTLKEVSGAANQCAQAGSVVLAAAGNVFLDPTTSGGGFNGGASTAATDDAGQPCAAGPGGNIVITAGGTLDAGTAHLTPGAGTPAGTVQFSQGTPVDAGLAPVVLTEPFVAVSHPYDLGAPSNVTAVRVVTRATPTEGAGRVEIAMADDPNGPWGPFTSDVTSMGAHRYVRWRATVDRFFFESAQIDRVEIDWSR